MNCTTDRLEQLIRDCGEGWLIDWHVPREQALSDLRDVLRRANVAGRALLGDVMSPLTPDALIEASSKNPHKVRAFLQVLGTATPQMLVMVWRVLQGIEISEIQMEYRENAPFRLRIRLSSSNDDRPELYESSDIDDAAVLRHLGTMKLGDNGLFDGFYALDRGRRVGNR
jgi:hypothetical protein